MFLNDLRREGVARELVNRIQNLRKDSGFEVTDRVRIVVGKRPEIEDALASFGDYVCRQTLAESISVSGVVENAASVEWDDSTLEISVCKA